MGYLVQVEIHTEMAANRVHEGQNALITGSARSIGEAIARNLASKGANVCIIYLSESSDEKASSLARELSATHSVRATSVRADVRTKEGCAAIVAHAQASLPANAQTKRFQVDVLVHSAALFHAAGLEDVTIDDFHSVYASNVLGPILLTQACRPHLPTDRSGRIVNLSSVGSKVGMAGLTLYGGAKGALEAMTRTWARELAESCTVNAVGVGSTMTDMLAAAPHEAKVAISSFYPVTPLCAARDDDSELQREFAASYGGRAAYPEEIAGVVAMICSPESRWMTGSLVAASGGMWMSS
ncbi:3-oxoacyl-[acyl-carrier-protein] reductase [Pyricularia oryzae 70-15]|uniref:3-oxoacyl-[acyl-carrier-protein] reductase n=4 Tax=Pyricularia TaxID=48558 RepID=G4MR10_PYRO7|nr:3-oxoacyl-[acyl-carrier-protein] reductase [Pyricularia oryzae 70-15]EHA56545.1 3-oxoacyl-[acyl-carrier-protein] reductase [Pyricularia oryzae 70-15]ELQ45136.1 3-oxoacyl-[acyl-carrier-protein] reductase [Pyricularia oryzae Y34]